jgi:hypothetical protein
MWIVVYPTPVKAPQCQTLWDTLFLPLNALKTENVTVVLDHCFDNLLSLATNK